jgi:hypothetical protein
MKKLIEFLIYLAGVVFFSQHYYTLKGALDILPLFVFVIFYLFGVSKFATFASSKIASNSQQGNDTDKE